MPPAGPPPGSSAPEQPALNPAPIRMTRATRGAARSGARFETGEPFAAVVRGGELAGGGDAAEPSLADDRLQHLLVVTLRQRGEGGKGGVHRLAALGVVDELQRPGADVPDVHHVDGVPLNELHVLGRLHEPCVDRVGSQLVPIRPGDISRWPSRPMEALPHGCWRAAGRFGLLLLFVRHGGGIVLTAAVTVGRGTRRASGEQHDHHRDNGHAGPTLEHGISPRGHAIITRCCSSTGSLGRTSRST